MELRFLGSSIFKTAFNGSRLATVKSGAFGQKRLSAKQKCSRSTSKVAMCGDHHVGAFGLAVNSSRPGPPSGADAHIDIARRENLTDLGCHLLGNLATNRQYE